MIGTHPPVLTLILILSGSAALAQPLAEPLSLWYRQPARQWVEALAVGNGRLGAMVFGGVAQERIQVNEDTLWAGGPYDPANPEALAALPKVRELIFAGRYREAHNLIGQKMMAKPLTQMPYQCVGDLLLEFPDANALTDYRRDLNLDTAMATIAYTVDGVHYTREVFSSPVDQVIVIRLKADKPGKITFTAGMKTPQKASVTVESPNTLVMQGVNGGTRAIAGALKFQARVTVAASGGQIVPGDGQITVNAADSTLLLIAVATSYRSFKDVTGDPEALTKETIAKASGKSFDALLQDHVAAHQKLFRRVTLDLGTTAAARRPTDERIRDPDKANDPQLAALYFQFGRYLLISSSRPGCQPANLQGIWNDSMNPPWQSKYTININTEMNYWPAEPTNLGECVEPLVTMVMDLTETGARTAQTMYNAGGWVTHHNTDLWRASAPIDGPQWGMWPMGGAWLCLHLWDHYDYSRDKDYLAKVYPALKGAAQFFFDTLVEEPKHKWLVTCPSLSPENGHPFGTSVCAGPTMDMQILRDLFSNCIRAAEILGVDEDFRKQAAATRQRLAPNQIGSAGQLQEWLEDWDMKAPEIHHRHVSHLYGLYPSDQIHVRTTPDLAAAARKSLEIRGDEATGWGIGWRLNLWARLHDGEHAYKILAMLLRPERTYPNMFDAHPPFQIDGNFGGTAGIGEMLLQSCAGEIELLPALPKAWPAGSVKGLRARGGFELDVQWKESRLVNVTVRSLAGGSCRLRYGAVTHDLSLVKGQSARWDGVGVIATTPAMASGASPAAAKHWTADNGNGTYSNPLFYEEFEDPDVIRVGTDYYLAGTTMHMNPAVQLMHSKDLVNWELAGYCMDRLDLGPAFRLEDGRGIYGRGIWAPCIRYHNGMFYVFSNLNGVGLQVFRSKSIHGPWERNQLPGRHDLSVLFDDDGKIYIISGNRSPYPIEELAPDLKSFVPGVRRRLDARMGEGHHLYKIKGKYYDISAIPGATTDQMVARADSIDGPWTAERMVQGESLGVPTVAPVRVTDRDRGLTLHQGGMCDTPSGEWWSVIMSDHGSAGRMVALVPIIWDNGFPIIGLPGNLRKAPNTWIKPNTGFTQDPKPAFVHDDNFDSGKLNPEWQWNHVPDDTTWSITEKPGVLRLHSLPASDFYAARNSICQRPPAPESIMTVELDTSSMVPGDTAGLALLSSPYAWIGVVKSAEGTTLQMLDNTGSGGGRRGAPRVAGVPPARGEGVSPSNPNRGLEARDTRGQDGRDTKPPTIGPANPPKHLWLRVHCNFDTDQAIFSWSADGKEFTPLGNPFTMTFQLRTFQGVRPSLFHYNTSGQSGGYVDFDNYTVDEPRARGIEREIPVGQTVVLTSGADGSYLAANAQNDTLVSVGSGMGFQPMKHRQDADATSGGAVPQNAKFQVIDLGLGRVALKATNGKVVSADESGVVLKDLAGASCGDAESFQWVNLMRGDTMLMSLTNHHYLTTKPNEPGPVTATATGPSAARKSGAEFKWKAVE